MFLLKKKPTKATPLRHIYIYIYIRLSVRRNVESLLSARVLSVHAVSLSGFAIPVSNI